MSLRPRKLPLLAAIALTAILLAAAGVVTTAVLAEPDYEVWAVDQSGAAGTLYVYDGGALVADPATAAPVVVDLATQLAPFCEARTGSTPTRAHMIDFSPDGRIAILAYVGTGHVAFLDASTHEPVACIDAGVQAHAAYPAKNGEFVLVADQNGRALHRIDTDANGNGAPYEAEDDYRLDAQATLALAGDCRTPSGVLCQDLDAEHARFRPNTAPICPILDASSRFAFVTLAGGGLFVVDVTQTPLAIVGEYDRRHVKPNGCGGIEKDGRIYINSGGGPGNPAVAELYVFSLDDFSSTPNAPNAPRPYVVYTDTEGAPDTHGMLLHPSKGGRYLWVADRAGNELRVVDTRAQTLVGSIALEGASADATPDLLAAAPKGKHVFASLRGPCPLTANDPVANNAQGATPGVGVIRVDEGGRGGELVGVARITSTAAEAFDCASVAGEDATTERADVHAIGVRVK